jgi:large conductance mechanosensitive channel
MSLLKEFKDFAMKGNIVDLATAVIIGGAFGKIVSSFVNDVLMPPIGLLLGNVDFKDLKLVLKAAEVGADGVETVAAVTLNYGMFVQNIIDFIIIAFSVFMVIKAYKATQKKEEVAPAPPPAPPVPTNEEKLLAEIRDLLKKQS